MKYPSKMGQFQEEQPISIAPLLPVIFTALGLFLAINGPSDWTRVWNQLVNPPADARHAVRVGEPKLKAQIHQQYLRDYAIGVEKSLDANVRDGKARLALVQRIFGGLGLEAEVFNEVADLLEGMNMTNLKQYFIKLRDYADKKLHLEKKVHAQFLEKSTKFVDNLMKLPNQRK